LPVFLLSSRRDLLSVLPQHSPNRHPERSEGPLYFAVAVALAFLLSSPKGYPLFKPQKIKLKKRKIFSAEKHAPKNHVFTTKTPQFTIKKPRSAPQKIARPQQKRPFRLPKNN
jgi:hypothetical protein